MLKVQYGIKNELTHIYFCLIIFLRLSYEGNACFIRKMYERMGLILRKCRIQKLVYLKNVTYDILTGEGRDMVTVFNHPLQNIGKRFAFKPR